MTLLAFLGISLFLIFLVLLSYLIYDYSEQKRFLKSVFDLEDSNVDLLEQQTSISKLELKLHRAGTTLKEFNEIRFLGLFLGAMMLFLVLYMQESMMVNILLGVFGIFSATYFPYLYLDEMYKARVERIEGDLSTFLDMIIIFLEAGSGLNNAMLEVTKRTTEVIGNDLLSEINRFVLESATLSADNAFDNFVQRTGSVEIATLAGFLKLSQETGLGVKTIFESQGAEIKAKEFLKAEKKAATVNLMLTMTLFTFILPALGLFVWVPKTFG
jgi:tight adherence protein C